MASSNVAGSIFKQLKYLGNIVKEPLKIEIPGKTPKVYTETYLPPDKVTISPKFFRSAKCLMCGKCCKIGATLVYPEIAQPLAKKLDWKEIPLFLNGSEQSVFVHENEPKTQCDFAVYKGFLWKKKLLCDIHENKPNHCALPMIEIDRTKNNSRLTKRPRGRNWLHPQCPAEFKTFDYNEFISWDLKKLIELNDLANKLSIITWLPEILSWLSKEHKYLQIATPKEAVVIYEKKESEINDRKTETNEN